MSLEAGFARVILDLGEASEGAVEAPSELGKVLWLFALLALGW
jgi:hypothetical protein